MLQTQTETIKSTDSKAEQTRRLSRRRFLKRTLFGLAALTAADSTLIEPRWLRWETVEVPIRDLPAAFDGYRIVLLTDFHYPRWISGDLIRKAVTMGNAFDPDLMALTGDFFHTPYADRAPNITGLFDHSLSRDGVVGVLGNHDHYMSSALARRALADNTLIRLIENRSFLVERGGEALAIGGVGDLWCGVVAPEQTFADVAPNIPRILLSHNPDVAEEMTPGIRVDLQLSGHTHGGQVRVPFGPAPAVPSHYGNKFRQGLVQGKRHRVYVSRGLCTVRWVRFWCPPEVTGIILRRAETSET